MGSSRAIIIQLRVIIVLMIFADLLSILIVFVLCVNAVCTYHVLPC